MTYWMRVDGVYCPEVTDDPETAQKWLNRKGKVVRVDETTEIKEIKTYVEVEHERP